MFTLLLSTTLATPVAAASATVPAPVPASTAASDLLVDPGGPYTVQAGSTVELDGSGSITFSCSQVEYAWDIDGDYVIDLDASASATATFDATDIDGPETRRVSLFLTCWLPGDLDSVTERAGTGLSVQNAPPVIEDLSYSPTDLDEGDSVHLEVDFSDPEPADTQTVTWEVERLGSYSGETLDVVLPQDGAIEVLVTVEDDDLDDVVQALVLDVANVAPTLGGSPGSDARVDEPYAFLPTAEDPGVEDALRFSAELPPGATVDSATGELQWTPTVGQEGDWALSLSVQDEDGASDSLQWTVTVASSAPPSDSPRDTGGIAELTVDPLEIAGEGCSCGSTAPASLAWLLGGLPLLGLRRRR